MALLVQEVSEWFGNLGCKMPYGVNVADFILDLASGEFEDSRPMLGVMGADRKAKLIEVSLLLLLMPNVLGPLSQMYRC